MRNRWSEDEACSFIERYGPRWGAELALRTYSSRLLGADPDLVLHGGGNTSVKAPWTNVLGEKVPAIFVKASGQDMAAIEPQGHLPLDLAYLRKLGALDELSDEAMADELGTHLLVASSASPSIETLAHAFVAARFVDHSHADAILALTNRPDGVACVRDAVGDQVIVLDYVRPGFRLAKAVAEAYEANAGRRAMVWMRHGLVTWGDTARESYTLMIDLVTRAERYLAASASRAPRITVPVHLDVAAGRLRAVAPVVRGLLAEATGDGDNRYRRVILRPLVTRETLEFLAAPGARELALSPPLTADHLIRIRAWPLWVDSPAFEQPERLREQLSEAVRRYAADYEAYVSRHAFRSSSAASRTLAVRVDGRAASDLRPRVVLLPGVGALCAGPDVESATIARDITAHTLAVKSRVASGGRYDGLAEEHLFEMEYHPLQRLKLRRERREPLAARVALVTGAAGAIGAGICQGLLAAGCHVAVTDLPGGRLDDLVAELRVDHGDRVAGVPLDVTDAGSVDQAFGAAIETWGGVDLVVVNAGIAHVSALTDLDVESFRRLERVNVEGTLLLLAASGRHFRLQGTGGDIVLVSTKNVFAPGAKFGAYSATKAAAHQLARVASLELADEDVRVNMVAPDAVFGDGARKSGLWVEVGPDRMRARGLDQAGLEEYYRNRNLLKARVTAEHVARAVLFFATRQTPTTGVTIPVDGGLPDSTPR